MADQQYWWKPGVVSMPSMTLGSGVKGGFVRVSWGNISFAPNSFISEPAPHFGISLDWGIDSANLMHIFDGEIYRRSYNNKTIVYDIFEPEYDTKLLAEGLDVKDSSDDPESEIIVYPDMEVTQPLVIGTVDYMTPQRTGLAIEQKYYMPDFAAGTYHFYENGYPIDDHWTVADGYAERSVNINEDLSISGTGNMTTLNDVFTWASAQMGLDYVNVHGGDVSLNYVEYSQMLMVDFLDKIAYYCNYQFYIKDGVVYLVDMNQDNGQQDIEEFDFVEISYEWPMAIKEYSAAWTLRKFNSGLVVLENDEKEVKHYTDSAIGDEVSITPYDQTIADVGAKIATIAAQEKKVIVSLSLPLDQLPAIGEKITFDDRKQAHDISGYLRVQTYSINYSSKTLDIKGTGEIAFS